MDIYQRFTEGDVYVTAPQLRAEIERKRAVIKRMVGSLWPNILGAQIDEMQAELDRRAAAQEPTP